MLESWLEALGARIIVSIRDPKAGYGGKGGIATLKNLRIRYIYGRDLDLGWEPRFDCWANSVDWTAKWPESQEALVALLDKAEFEGFAGRWCGPETMFEPRRIEA